MRKDREQRYQSVRDLLLDLRTLQEQPSTEFEAQARTERFGGTTTRWMRRAPATVAAVAAVLAVCGAGVWRILTPAVDGSVHSLAVLPLDNFSGDANQEYFSDGMTDALITELAQVEGLRVISRASIMQVQECA